MDGRETAACSSGRRDIGCQAGHRIERIHVASVRVAARAAPAAKSAAKSSMLLEALKEELFQLEVERKQGKITPADYEKAKAALDQTLDRALKRQG